MAIGSIDVNLVIVSLLLLADVKVGFDIDDDDPGDVEVVMIMIIPSCRTISILRQMHNDGLDYSILSQPR